MEEQCLHAHQIQKTNHLARTLGRLSAVSVVHPDSTVSHHSDKVSMETACLTKAQARFTQANNTPFLTPPLLTDLGLLHCYDPNFDTIAAGQYQPLAGIAPSADKLL